MYSIFLRGMTSRSPTACDGQRTVVRLDKTGDNVGAALLAAAALVEHGERLADAGRHAEVDAEPTARPAARLQPHLLEHLLGGGSVVVGAVIH